MTNAQQQNKNGKKQNSLFELRFTQKKEERQKEKKSRKATSLT
jgi:hypothetical protein